METDQITIEDMKSRRRIAKEFGLSDVYLIFADAYRIDRNGTQAILEAYPKASKRSARQMAYDLLADEGVRGYIDTLDLFDALKKNQDAADIIAELKNIAFFNPREVLGEGWKVKDVTEIPDSALACIKSIQHTRLGVNLTFYDKFPALDRLGKIHKLWSENFILGGEVKAIELLISDKRSRFAEDGGEAPE